MLAVAVCSDCGELGLWLRSLCSVVILSGGWGNNRAGVMLIVVALCWQSLFL